MIDSFIPDDCDFDISLVDSMPIITCAGRNHEAKVAKELVTKGFCSTKNQYYWGLKLHALAFSRKGRIPFPESITFTSAENNDLTVPSFIIKSIPLSIGKDRKSHQWLLY